MTYTREDLGAHYTPEDIADYLAALVDEGLPPWRLDYSVVDPACGDGALLRAVHRRRPSYVAVGVDRDQRALDEIKDPYIIRQCADYLTDAVTTPTDAVVMNPPYLGGTKVSGRFGNDYLNTLKERWGHAGRADISASFIRAACERARHAVVGIYTNTISQGDTRRVGLQWALAHGWEIYAADRNIPWPGKAKVTCSIVAMRRKR